MPQLVHPDWEEYPTNSWASSWHKLFKDNPNDDRKHLGWPGRFANVLSKAVNFYSAGENGGDEVLELAADNDVGILTGVTSSFAHHAWHKQELFKATTPRPPMKCVDDRQKSRLLGRASMLLRA